MAAQRQLGLVSATALVVASMIGSGVFTTSGFLLADLQTPGRVLAAWLGGGVLAMLGALSYGALARRFPESGGEYIFLGRTLHPAAGTLAGWVSLLVGFSAPLAAVALAFGEYTKDWFASPPVTGTCLIITFAAVHALHVQRGAWLQNAAVLLKLVLIGVLLCRAGMSLRAVTPAASGSFPLAAFAVSLVWVSFSYSGWNAAVYVAGEVREPGRNLPRSLLLGSGLVTVVYLALNAVFVYAAPTDKLAGKLEVGRIAAEALGGAALANFVTVLIGLALATAASSMIMAGPRVYARMADDGCLPRWFRFPAQGPPRQAILLQTILALLMLWSASFKALLTYIGFTLSLCTAGAVAGLIRQRRREGPALAVPGWPWVPALFVAGVLTMTTLTVAREPLASGVGLGTLGIGWLGWYLAVRRAPGSALTSLPPVSSNKPTTEKHQTEEPKP
ncbi:MAG TPA: amino acid permease [Verrucomicrobiae bacterium]